VLLDSKDENTKWINKRAFSRVLVFYDSIDALQRHEKIILVMAKKGLIALELTASAE
jgi:hypothetical protein